MITMVEAVMAGIVGSGVHIAGHLCLVGNAMLEIG